MYSPVFKLWAVLLGFSLAASPLYAQVNGSSTGVPAGKDALPLKAHASAAPPPTQEPDPNTEPDPDAAAESNTVSEPNAVSNQIPPDSGKKASPGDLAAPTVSTPQPDEGLAEPDQSSNMADYFQGIKDGKRNSRGKPLWILAGLSGTGLCICFGVAGIGIALAVPYYPPPPAEMLIGKSSKYVEGYFEGYTARIRWKNAGWALLGCLMAVAADIVLNYPVIFGNFHVDMDQ